MMEKALRYAPRRTSDVSVRLSVRLARFWGRSLEVEMRKVMSKAAVAAVAALSLCAALVASSEPASAQFRHGGGGFGGFHGGMGGFGGWHGNMGGWHGNMGGWHGNMGGWRGGVGGWGGGWRTAGWGG